VTARWRSIVIGAVVVAVLAAAAYVLLSRAGAIPVGPGSAVLPVVGTAAGGKQAGNQFDVIRATEIPATNPDLVGTLDMRQDNSLMVRPDSKGAPAGLVEVVIGSQTRLYRNATGDQLQGEAPASGSIQMVVAPYRLDQIAVSDHIIAWGARRGDRIVADVVMVEPLAVRSVPAH
jgi:hypothetical protein